MPCTVIYNAFLFVVLRSFIIIFLGELAVPEIVYAISVNDSAAVSESSIILPSVKLLPCFILVLSTKMSPTEISMD